MIDFHKITDYENEVLILYCSRETYHYDGTMIGAYVFNLLVLSVVTVINLHLHAECTSPTGTAIPIIIEGQFQAFQRFSSSKRVLKTVENRSTALNYYGVGSSRVGRKS